MPDGSEVEAEVVGFQTAGENWNEYLLDDGTRLRIKLVLTEVLRIADQYDAEGNPAYVARSQNVVAVDAPESVRREGGG